MGSEPRGTQSVEGGWGYIGHNTSRNPWSRPGPVHTNHLAAKYPLGQGNALAMEYKMFYRFGGE